MRHFSFTKTPRIAVSKAYVSTWGPIMSGMISFLHGIPVRKVCQDVHEFHDSRGLENYDKFHRKKYIYDEPRKLSLQVHASSIHLGNVSRFIKAGYFCFPRIYREINFCDQNVLFRNFCLEIFEANLNILIKWASHRTINFLKIKIIKLINFWDKTFFQNIEKCLLCKTVQFIQN